MFKKLLSSSLGMVLVLLLTATSLHAQTGTITGTITDANLSEPLPGANVFIPELNRGSAASGDGSYTINEVPYGTYKITFSFVGFQQTTRKVVVDQASVTVNVALSPQVRGLDNVVVTALGIERSERSLGYAVQELDGQDVNKVPETNFVNTLSGKVAGANITSSNAMGGSSRIVLRGSRSIDGNNQPLFIVDGVPLDNSNFSTTDQVEGGGGYDYGNAASMINPTDIASISILKGPSATALYGARAANGVVQITTKSGEGTGGIGVAINSGVTFKQIYGLPDYQNKYGGGANAPFSMNSQGQLVADFATDESWGPPLDGREVRQWYSYDPVNGLMGETTPWVAHPNNVENFFNTGVVFNNNISLAAGTDTYNYRLSLTNLNENGVYPESKMERSQVSFHGSLDLSDRLTTSLSANYINATATGRPGTGYDNENVFLQFNHFGQRQIALGEDSYMAEYLREDGSQRGWNWSDPVAGTFRFTDNPYWVRNKNYQNDDTQRIYGNFSISYDLTDYLNITAEARTDYYTERRNERLAVGSQAVSRFEESVREVQETNGRLTIQLQKDLNQNFSLDFLAGGNLRYNDYSLNRGNTQGGLSAPGIYTLENSVSRPDIDDYYEKKRVHSIFGSATLGFQEMIYLDATLRNDWSSTLPEGNNSYLYPSVSTSFVFSDLEPFQDTDVLSFGKIRVGWAQVSSDTEPYQLSSTYPFNTPFGSLPQLSVSNTLNNANLKPEVTSSWEVGTELDFFNNRLGLDVTYYDDVTKNQILDVEVSRASGYTRQLINAGKISNKGVEVALSGTPILTDTGFRWDISLNWSRNVSKVLKLTEGIDNYTLGEAPFGVTINARVGEPYGALVGTDFVYDENGNKVIAPYGGYLPTTNPEVLGSYIPDWTSGLSTTFGYKGLQASITFNGQKGGDIYSITNLFGKYSGILDVTARNNIREVGMVPEGVDTDGNEWTTAVDPETFYKTLFSVKAAHVYDASYIKIQQASVSYTLPTDWTANTPIRNLTLSLVGNNLATLFKNTPNIDPSTALSSGNVQGIEVGQIPPQRTYGFSVRLEI